MLHWWDDIKDDLQLGPEYEGRAGRARFLQPLPVSRQVECKPPKSSPSRWCSFQHAASFMDPFTAVDNMLMALTCIRKGWVATLDELLPKINQGPTFAETYNAIQSMPTVAKSAAAADCIVAVVSEGQSSSSSGHPVVAKAKSAASPATNAAKARAKAQQDRDRAKNTLLCVAQYKGDRDFVHRVRRLCLVSTPEALAHGDFASNILSSEDVRIFRRASCRGLLESLV